MTPKEQYDARKRDRDAERQRQLEEQDDEARLEVAGLVVLEGLAALFEGRSKLIVEPGIVGGFSIRISAPDVSS